MIPHFSSHEQSHRHSLQTLETLYEYDDFMESIKDLVDLGSGSGLDLEWWATRTTRDEVPQPLNIRCLGIDLEARSTLTTKYSNLQHQFQNFEDPILATRKFDVAWCHDAFQYALNPLQTLKNWWNIMNPNGMLVIIVPQTTNLESNAQAFDQASGCYYHWTPVSLIHALAVSGFDCRDGYFLKAANDPWLHAIVYKSEHEPMDPRTTSWYDLADRKLIPDSAAASALKYTHVRQRDLILPWLDKSIESFANH
jgi:SAM-dependent methyltransferase